MSWDNVDNVCNLKVMSMPDICNHRVSFISDVMG